MATYTESQKKRMLEFPIELLLQHFGKRTDHRGDMYYSPFRDEEQPSFHINRSENIWMDFGNGQGGNILTLISLMKGIPLSRSWDFLAGLDATICVPSAIAESAYQSKRASRIIIDSVSREFTSANLVRYALSRGISRHILERYCSQVTYHLLGSSGTRWCVIGFPAAEGWILRHSYEGMYSKRCTGSACSFLDPSGELITAPACHRVEVFEGFFDFLSFLVLRERTMPLSDICVLNSVNNLSRGMDFIASHREVSCWLDTDTAGMKALGKIREECPSAADHLQEMGSCKDVNDLLQKELKKDNIVSNNVQTNSLTIKK